MSFKLPGTCYVEDSVSIGNDTVIGPHCTLLGQTSIGRGCIIEAGCFIKDQDIVDGSHIRSGTRL